MPGAAGSLHDVDNLPYGVFTLPGEAPRIGARIGDYLLDLAPVAASDLMEIAHALEQPSLNRLMACPPDQLAGLRAWLVDLLTTDAGRDTAEPFLLPIDSVRMQLPIEVGDYVDFYASEHHATNVGMIFRPDGDALLPNWKHLPVGYHGRAGTVVASGTAVRRPSGQRRGEGAPEFGPSTRLDIEAELGFVVGRGSALGDRVPASAFTEHVFGVVGLNDWSARDIQAWEYVPLGPFLGKSFATSISTWVTPLAALDAAWTALPGQDPTPLPYLEPATARGLDIAVEIELNGEVIARPPYAAMYWSPAQMLAHLTVNGASIRTGDLFGSGTISGADAATQGSLLELTWGWREPVGRDGRLALEDGDTVVLRYTAPGTLGGRIALGEVTGQILPASM
ncbi:fumarylacetoacetase [Nocardioides dubius]|uniref:fumarylacetoacetase n=1 Tax=Nocardioides dubius TaxID=317019 RepID=A0ABP4E8W3_9ACTN